MSTRDGGDARRVAIEAVRRIDEEGAYANLVLSGLLEASRLDPRDRGLVTELTYGATRMRRACDWLVDRFLVSPPPPALRAALRVGAYQLAFTRVPPHAAVSATVAGAAKRNRGVVNAVLRRVADSLPVSWPDDATRLSVPDWLLARLRADLGPHDALAMLETMNRAPEVTERADGYIQDEASQWVADLVGASAGDLILDLCAAPGGKATAMASRGATVVAGDRRIGRVGLIGGNAQRLGAADVVALAADGLAPPFPDATFDRVLVDAPCSGLGVLRRRADARWRVSASSIDDLAALQRGLLDRAIELVRPGGTLVYSVCTVTSAETVGVTERFAEDHGDLTARPVPDPWRPHGSGGLLLPQDHGTDGMAVFIWQRR